MIMIKLTVKSSVNTTHLDLQNPSCEEGMFIHYLICEHSIAQHIRYRRFRDEIEQVDPQLITPGGNII